MSTKYNSTADLPWHGHPVWTTTQSKSLPSYSELPILGGIRHAWDAFGRGDELGTVNLLTPEVIAAAASEIKDGTVVTLNLPLQLPTHPSFHRMAVKHEVSSLFGEAPVNDDIITWNTQSGTQTDGLRHFGCLEMNCFYQGVPSASIKPGPIAIEDPLNLTKDQLKIGISGWAQHGVTGRGVLLDMVSYYQRDGAPLPYDPWTTYSVSLEDLKACAAYQKTEFKFGDNLIIRMGWTMKYYNSTAQQKLDVAVGGNEHFAGVENSDAMAAWIWDNHFASVSADAPAFEAWPPAQGEKYLHETILAGFGCPIGEFFECEQLAEVCKQKKRYTFFYVSNLLNILGGCASTANASCTF